MGVDTKASIIGAGLVAALCTGCGGGGGSSGATGAAAAPLPTGVTAGISIVAGNPTESGNLDGAGGAARFNNPVGITIDAAGNLYVADRANCTIRSITPAGLVSTISGSSQRCDSVDGLATAARYAYPTALAWAPGGRIYVTDARNVREIGLTGEVRTVATLETGVLANDAAPESFYGGGIAVDKNGNLVVTNGYGTRRIAPGGATTILEGTATRENGFQTAYLLQRGVAVDGSGNVYVADLVNRVARIDTAGKAMTLAGSSGATGAGDGVGGAARFSEVVALTLDAQGNLYAADRGNNLIRKITQAEGGTTTTVAGKAGASTLQTGALPGSFALLNGLVADGKGALYATSGNAVVKITLP